MGKFRRTPTISSEHSVKESISREQELRDWIDRLLERYQNTDDHESLRPEIQAMLTYISRKRTG